MLDWTPPYRYFARQSPATPGCTEMVTTGALIHGDIPRHLRFDPMESPIALQLGGSELPTWRTAPNSQKTGATTR